MRTLLAALFALALFALPSAAQAQYCWDTVCAAGTPAADCWRAWCVDGWSYPAYPYRAPGWYRTDLPSPYTAPATRSAESSRPWLDIVPQTPAGQCAVAALTGSGARALAWNC